MIGLPPGVASHILNDACNKIIDNEIDVGDMVKAGVYCGSDNYSAYQLVYLDRNGLLPWDDSVNFSEIYQQLVFKKH